MCQIVRSMAKNDTRPWTAVASFNAHGKYYDDSGKTAYLSREDYDHAIETLKYPGFWNPVENTFDWNAMIKWMNMDIELFELSIDPSFRPTANDIIFVRALPNPVGVDIGKEQLVLANISGRDLSLEGLKIRSDGSERKLSGVIPSGNEFVVHLDSGQVQLGNRGGAIILVGSTGAEITRGRYHAEGNSVSLEGHWIHIRSFKDSGHQQIKIDSAVAKEGTDNDIIRVKNTGNRPANLAGLSIASADGDGTYFYLPNIELDAGEIFEIKLGDIKPNHNGSLNLYKNGAGLQLLSGGQTIQSIEYNKKDVDPLTGEISFHAGTAR